MKRRQFLPVLFSLVMLICVLFLIWYLPSLGERRFRLEDIQKSIETSLGRERKQQHEYDETVAAIPLTEAELERVAPQAKEAQKEVRELKKERKNLRKERKELTGTDPSETQEVAGDE
ncbi:MAG: hypothetical protein K6F61_11130 [Clostridiales bacterium]|nr:hypothetical protein [Clostridiales bacterium]